MTFTKIDSNLYGTTFNLKLESRVFNVTIRLDGRDGSYRVDRLGMLGYIWEAIDNGQGFSSVAKATSYVRRWRKAAVAQNSLCPNF